MDQFLQEERRRAQLNPNDIDTLWRYIRRLERINGGDKDIPLYAALTSGEIHWEPTGYEVNVVPYKEGDSKPVLYGRFMDEYDRSLEFYSEIYYAWIITEHTKLACEALMQTETGCDSERDAVCRAALNLLQGMAIKTIEFPSDPREVVDDDGEATLEPELEDEIWDSYRTYRRGQDKNRVRLSFDRSEDFLLHMSHILGGWCDDNPQHACETGCKELSYPPRKLLVQDINGGKPFEAVIFKQENQNYGHYIRCEHCNRQAPFGCNTLKRSWGGCDWHELDQHIILEIDGVSIPNMAAFLEWCNQ